MNSTKGTHASSSGRQQKKWTKLRPKKGKNVVCTTLRLSTTATNYRPDNDDPPCETCWSDTDVTRYKAPTSECIRQMILDHVHPSGGHDDNATYRPTALPRWSDGTHYDLRRASWQISSQLRGYTKKNIESFSREKPSVVANMSLYDEAGKLVISIALESRLDEEVPQSTQQGTIASGGQEEVGTEDSDREFWSSERNPETQQLDHMPK